MNQRDDLLKLEADLARRCGRIVALHPTDTATVRIVLDPIHDKGRIDLLATRTGDMWTISDRGVHVDVYGHEINHVLTMLRDIDVPLGRDGDAIVVSVDDAAFVDTVAAFVEHMEFIPVLIGLWSEASAAA